MASSSAALNPQPLELARETVERIQTLGTVSCSALTCRPAMWLVTLPRLQNSAGYCPGSIILCICCCTL